MLQRLLPVKVTNRYLGTCPRQMGPRGADPDDHRPQPDTHLRRRWWRAEHRVHPHRYLFSPKRQCPRHHLRRLGLVPTHHRYCLHYRPMTISGADSLDAPALHFRILHAPLRPSLFTGHRNGKHGARRNRQLSACAAGNRHAAFISPESVGLGLRIVTAAQRQRKDVPRSHIATCLLRMRVWWILVKAIARPVLCPER